MSTSPWMVIKFGGTSVSTRQRWQHILQIIKQHIDSGYRVVVVCSAIAKTSNLLLQAINQSLLKVNNSAFEELSAITQQLCADLNSNIDLTNDTLQQLGQLLDSIALIGDASDKVRAKIMAYGELLSTQLGHCFLQQQGLESHWLDARDWLKATPEPSHLVGYCDDDIDPELQQHWQAMPHPVIITQGFICGGNDNDTVLLGRGGSDSTAAYLAAKLNAERVEIWTDVPGMYTANPRQIPEARLLMKLSYNEAQEMASMGAKVLHPRCIAPVRRHTIPLHIKQTDQPNRDGTVISNQATSPSLPIKAIISKLNILLITIETVNMWQQVGFLSQVFDSFKQHRLSIDLISTSEASLTVSIDNQHNSVSTENINALLSELNQFSKAKLIGPCTSISLVGENIRMVLPKLGEAFDVFESQQIHMMSLAANNLNLTFVVDNDQAAKLCLLLHNLLVEQHPRRHLLGSSWREEFGDTSTQPTPWWQHKRQELLSCLSDSSAHYIYDMDTIRHAIDQLKQLSAVDRCYYAIKANPHKTILEQVFKAGLCFECVSIEEITHVITLFPKIDRQRILFTPNFAEQQEYQAAIDLGVILTIDSLYPLQHWPDLFQQQHVMLRLDPGFGAGHHKYVCTGGSDSKFGIPVEQTDTILSLTKRHNIIVKGLHIHSGSGILAADSWSKTYQQLIDMIDLFPSATAINIGGGLGIVEKPGQLPLNISALNQALADIKSNRPHIELWMEPGRFVVARAGVLIAKVTQVKRKGDTVFVGISTGMNSLIRPALYGAYHEIVNLSRIDQPVTQVVNVVGPICESGDTLGYCRALPETLEGDIILVANTGAYGHCMGSSYNLRKPAEEIAL